MPMCSIELITHVQSEKMPFFGSFIQKNIVGSERSFYSSELKKSDENAAPAGEIKQKYSEKNMCQTKSNEHNEFSIKSL